jgi:hypothetical protein
MAYSALSLSARANAFASLIPDGADGVYRFEHVKVSLIEAFSRARKRYGIEFTY